MSIKIERVNVCGWEAAIRGARNPMNSWAKSDTYFDDPLDEAYTINGDTKTIDQAFEGCGGDYLIIGPNDHKLLMNLCKGGSEESKWRRMVHVQMDITAPLYWWKEFETYKVGTVSNSCSTMHKIHAKEFGPSDFSTEHMHYYEVSALENIVDLLNKNQQYFLESNATDKKFWWQMIQLLPSCYNQLRTIDLNYEVLAAQYRQRKDHKLDEWRDYCSILEMLPYSEFITLEE